MNIPSKDQENYLVSQKCYLWFTGWFNSKLFPNNSQCGPLEVTPTGGIMYETSVHPSLKTVCTLYLEVTCTYKMKVVKELKGEIYKKSILDKLLKRTHFEEYSIVDETVKFWASENDLSMKIITEYKCET